MPIDYSEYPPNWLTEIRPAVLARAKQRCENCGIQNGVWVRKEKNGKRQSPGAQELDMIISKMHNSGYSYSGALRAFGYSQIVLTIAHLDHDYENHQVSIDRLRAWCQKCHLDYDRPRHIENRKNGRNWRKNQTKLNL